MFIQTLFSVLTSYKLKVPGLETYCEDLMKMWDFNKDGKISWTEYRDDRQEQLHKLVEATLQGRKLEAPVEEEVPVLQLLDALKQSVTQALGEAPAAEDKTSNKRAPKKRASRRSA